MQTSCASPSGHTHVSAIQTDASAGRHWQMATSVQGSVTAGDAVLQVAL